MLKIALYCLLLFSALHSAGQSLVRCEDGTSYWVIERDNILYTITLRGDVGEGNIPELLNVEDKALHYILLDKADYLDPEKGGDNSDTALLTRFVKGEEEALSLSKMQPVYEFLKLPSGQSFLLWHHDWFDSTGDVEQQAHATIIVGETIVWLSSPKFLWQDLSNIEAFLTEAISTVTIVESAEGLCE